MNQANAKVLRSYECDVDAATPEVEWMEKIARRCDWLGSLPNSLLMGIAFKYHLGGQPDFTVPVVEEVEEFVEEVKRKVTKKAPKKELVTSDG